MFLSPTSHLPYGSSRKTALSHGKIGHGILLVYFCCFCFWCHIQETMAKIKVMKISPTFSSRSFTVSDLKYLLDLNWFLCMVEGSHFILLHVYPIFPTLFVGDVILFPLGILGTLVQDQLIAYTWVYFWALCCIGLYVCSSVSTILAN